MYVPVTNIEAGCFLFIFWGCFFVFFYPALITPIRARGSVRFGVLLRRIWGMGRPGAGPGILQRCVCVGGGVLERTGL